MSSANICLSFKLMRKTNNPIFKNLIFNMQIQADFDVMNSLLRNLVVQLFFIFYKY